MDEQEKERLRNQQKLEQTSAGVNDFMVSYWRRIYDNLLKEGFDEAKAMSILQAYIMGMAAGRITPS